MPGPIATTGFPLVPLIVFAFGASATPGPNNIMMLSSAAAHGLRRTLPQLAGISIGFGVMVALVASGLGLPLARQPALQLVVLAAGAAWMVWLAWRIATAPVRGAARPPRPLGFWSACAIQWVNPKAWLMATTATAAFLPQGRDPLVYGPLIGLVFTLVGVPCVGGWGVIGASGAPLLRHPARLRVFNVAMALLLLATVASMLAEQARSR